MQHPAHLSEINNPCLQNPDGTDQYLRCCQLYSAVIKCKKPMSQLSTLIGFQLNMISPALRNGDKSIS